MERIKFNYISVLDHTIDTFSKNVVFPGAASLISAVITNIGKFKNMNTDEIIQKAYKVKLSNGDKQLLDEKKTSKFSRYLDLMHCLFVEHLLKLS